MRLGDQAAILTLSRLASFGMMLASPVFLAHLIPIEDFGRYREFVLYASILQSFGSFAIPDSLLYFIPLHPDSQWRIVRQTVVLTALCSGIVLGGLWAVDAMTGGSLVGGYLVPLVLYTFFLINLDFWEWLMIAVRRPKIVMIYTAVRLALRLIVAVGAAALTRSVFAIIWSLVVLEALRFLVSAIVWRRLDRSASEPPLVDGYRTQLRFCVPMGVTMLLVLIRRNLATIAVARWLGPVALARYSIGKYGEPIVATVRNSLSSVVLPEMVRREGGQSDTSLGLWKRATAICALLMFPIVPVVVRYAEPLIATLFGEDYRAGAIVMQLYMLVLIRECFDFSPALRAKGSTAPLVHGTLAGLVAAAVVVLPLVAYAGIAGAMISFVVGSFVEAIWLAVTMMALYRVSAGNLLPWMSIIKIAAATAIASVVLMTSLWTDVLGVAGVIPASCCYGLAYAVLIWILRVPESAALVEWVRKRLPARARFSN
jgi:O-antigen/teichoic acid export membrane protein